ncbi:MAG: tetratricopeptide repeat protein [Magnetococcus sp. WYHC-3]
MMVNGYWMIVAVVCGLGGCAPSAPGAAGAVGLTVSPVNMAAAEGGPTLQNGTESASGQEDDSGEVLEEDAVEEDHGEGREESPELVLEEESPADATPVEEYTLSQEDTQRAVFHYLLGNMHLRDRDWRSAEDAFRVVAGVDGRAPDVAMWVAQLTTQRGDTTQAEAFARQAIDSDPGNPRNRLLYGELLSTRQQYAEAVAQFRAILESHPKHTRARLLMAQNQGLMGDMDGAQATLQVLFDKPETAWRGYLTLGRLMRKAGAMDQAVDALQQARTMAPDALEPVLVLGELLSQMDRSQESEALYRDFLARHPDSRQIHSELGRLLLDRDDRDAALAEFREVLRLAPESVQARLSAALILIGQGDYPEALKDLRLAEAVQPDNPAILYFLGQTLELLDRNGEARELYARLPGAGPYHADAQFRLALMAAHDGDAATARSIMETLLEQYPDRSDLRVKYNRVLFQLEDHAGVVANAATGLEHFPEQTQLLFDRAMALDKLKRWPEAERDLQAYVKVQPDDAQALNYLGYSWADRNEKLGEAYELLKRATELEPGDGFITDSLGWVLFRMNRLDEALITIRRAVELEPDDPTIVEHLGDVLNAMKKPDEALGHWRRALDLNGENKPRLEQKIQRIRPAP